MSEDKNDKGKSILGAPPKVGKKETKQNNHCSTNKKSQPKKPHFCDYYGASGHTRPNCYKWLATQQSNNVSSFGSQNQHQLSLAPLANFLRLSCYSLISMDSTLLLIHLNKGSCKRNVLHLGVPSGRKKIPSDSFTFLISCIAGVVVWVNLVFAVLFVCFVFMFFNN